MFMRNIHPSCWLKSALGFGALLFLTGGARAGDDTSPSESLRQGLYQEEVKRDPAAAAKHYQEVLNQYARQTPIAATALFRLAEIRKAQGDNGEAIALYQRLLAEFPRADTEGKLALERLADLGVKSQSPNVPRTDEEDAEIERLRALFASSPDLFNDSRPLEEAVRKGHLKVIRYLLGAGMRDPEWDAIMEAVGTGNIELTRMLLPGHDPKDGNHAGWLVAKAIGEGYVEMTRALIDAGFEPNWQNEPSGVSDLSVQDWPGPVSTHLMQAIAIGQFDIARLLLEKGADPKAVARETGLTALHCAAFSKHKDAPAMIKRLLDGGADPSALTAEFKLVRRSETGARGYRLSPMQCAGLGGSVNGIRMLAKAEADLKQADIFGPLGSAGKEVFEALLEAGADPNQRNAKGLPPLAQVIGRGDVELLECFLKHGADANIEVVYPTDHFERFSTAPVEGGLLFHVAFANKMAGKMAERLLDAGANPKSVSVAVLRRVAEGDQSGELIRRLLALGPVDWRDEDSINTIMCGMGDGARRVFADEVAVGILANRPGVHLMDRESGGIVTLEPPKTGSTSLASLFLNHIGELIGYGGTEDRAFISRVALVLVSKGKDGVRRQPLPLGGNAPFPEMKDGMFIEVTRRGEWAQDNSPVGKAIRAEVTHQLARRISFPIAVVAGGATRRLNVRGGLLAYDPTTGEVPLLSVGDMAMLHLPQRIANDAANPRCGGSVTLKRGADTTELDLRGNIAWNLSLVENDVLIVTPAPADPAESSIRIVAKDMHFARDCPVSADGGPVSLVELLADICSPTVIVTTDRDGEPKEEDYIKMGISPRVPTILPRPDFSRIVITRNGGDGKQQSIKVNLAEAINRCTDSTPPLEARAADVQLLAGDRVEIRLQPASGNAAWKGLLPAEERFFRKALVGTVKWSGADGVIHDFLLDFHQPDWHSTPYGLLPFRPRNGIPSTRLERLGLNGGIPCNVARNGKHLNTQCLFLRDGDEVTPANQ